MTTYRPFQPAHLPGILALCRAEGWPSFPMDPQRAQRAMTAPGVTTVVAEEDGDVVGFACMQSDGEIQAHLSLIAVDARHRRRGVGRSLIAEALARAGGLRIDLVTDSADAFYTSLPHRRMSGFRLYGAPSSSGAAKSAEPVVRPGTEGDREWITAVLRQRWGTPMISSRGRVRDAARLPAFVAELDGERAGAATYALDTDDEMELVTLDALVNRVGVGSALLRVAAEHAASTGCRRLVAITSNDNLDALRFYQRRGLRIAAVHRGVIDQARRVKATIPEIGDFGIPVHDEIELELAL